MAINYRKPSTDPAALTGSGLLDLYQAAKVSVQRAGLTGERAATYLVIDHSRSMGPHYRDGSVQALAERVLALAAHFDDDGVVPVVLFDTTARPPVEISLRDYQGAIERIRAGAGRMGQTNYAAAMQTVIEHYRASGATSPGFVVFQTDGSPTSRTETTQILCAASALPIFWQFVGFGDDEFAYLRRLDELPVPAKRLVDNAGFFAAGAEPQQVPDEVLYAQLTAEFPDWLSAARQAGIVG